MTQFLRLREDGCASLLSLIDTAFGFEQGRFLELLPKLYKKEYAPWESNLCAVEDGVPAAAVGAYYDTVSVGGHELRVCGIGNVGVHPDFRGRGHMVALMEALTDEMASSGADISVLDGDRFRYGHFGYDPACPKCLYEISAYSLGKQLGFVGADVCEITSADDGRLGGMEVLYRASDVTYSRGGGRFFDSLLSWKSRVFCAGDTDRVEAYCTLCGGHIGELRMAEYTPEKLGSFLLGVMNAAGCDSVRLSAGIGDTALRRAADAVCDESSVKDSYRMLVLNWEKLLRACLTAEAERVRPDDVSCVIRIRGATRTETVGIEISGGKVCVTASETEPELDLSREEASEIMLRAASTAREELPAPLRALFPLKFAISHQDMV